jgi:hypothetical protein
MTLTVDFDCNNPDLLSFEAPDAPTTTTLNVSSGSISYSPSREYTEDPSGASYSDYCGEGDIVFSGHPFFMTESDYTLTVTPETVSSTGTHTVTVS